MTDEQCENLTQIAYKIMQPYRYCLGFDFEECLQCIILFCLQQRDKYDPSRHGTLMEFYVSSLYYGLYHYLHRYCHFWDDRKNKVKVMVLQSPKQNKNDDDFEKKNPLLLYSYRDNNQDIIDGRELLEYAQQNLPPKDWEYTKKHVIDGVSIRVLAQQSEYSFDTIQGIIRRTLARLKVSASGKHFPKRDALSNPYIHRWVSRLLNIDTPIEEISDRLNVTVESIRKIVEKNSAINHKQAKITRERIVELRKEGLKPETISTKLDIAISTVYYHLRSYEYANGARELTSKKRIRYDKVKEVYKLKMTVTEKATQCGMSRKYYQQIVRELKDRGEIK